MGDDCGGVGASATERTRAVTARVKGWAKPLPFVRHAAQDAGAVDPSGTVPGPGNRVVFPGPEVAATMREGLATADEAIAEFTRRETEAGQMYKN
eukprot:NODE_7993_length_407_cov_173.534091.p3 GENE.NODE_7993_length_407_cov_173.534091~~NODE_7993_length_407_cov_173.534091.p3  ORF type:complete len:95 (+),score=23.60 NODE_7993_length_407_cov_173.534091:3-287(+)